MINYFWHFATTYLISTNIKSLVNATAELPQTSNSLSVRIPLQHVKTFAHHKLNDCFVSSHSYNPVKRNELIKDRRLVVLILFIFTVCHEKTLSIHTF